VDTHIRLPEDLHDRITSMAEGEYRSFNQQVIACLERCAAPPDRTRETRGTYNVRPTPEQ
jgi:hypothetical protein